MDLAEAVAYNPTRMLQDVRGMVRLGLYGDVPTLEDWKTQVEQRIEELQRHLETISLTDRIQMVSLQAEFHDLLGHDRAAADILRRHVVVGTGDLVSQVINFHGEPPALSDEESHKRYIRQIAWLHLEYAWVEFFRRGQFEEAIQQLEKILQFVRDKLIDDKRPSFGTLSRYYYYRGHCERSLRCFAESINSFMKSQENAKLRYLHKKDKLMREQSDRRTMMGLLLPQRRFTVITTARILGGGLSWNAIHQGRLMRAQQLCISAETLLLDTGQEPLKEHVESLKFTAKRRAASASTPEAKEAMQGLIRLFGRYQRVDDCLGQIRCGFEFARGHLDFLEMWEGKPEDRTRSIRAVKRWIAKLEKVAANIADSTSSVRLKLLRFRLETLEAEDAKLPQLLEAVQTLTMEHRNEQPLLAEREIVCALIHSKRRDWADALATLHKALLHTEKDPVIEGECLLQMAKVYVNAGDYVSARDKLRLWNTIGTVVENAYLHQLATAVANMINTGIEPFILKADDKDITWNRCESELRDWLARVAQYKAGPKATGKVVAQILGVDQSTWSRWKK